MEHAPTQLTDLTAVAWVLGGILSSLLLPIAVRTLRKYSKLEDKAPKPGFTERLRNAWHQYGGNRYLAVLAAASFVAGVVVFLLGLKFFTARDAALAGFAWESLVNKLLTQQQPGGQQGDTTKT
jgi:hypothetical protein